MRWAVVPGNAFGTHPVTRVDTVHGPLLRAADINLALVGFEHGRTDPTEPGDGDAEGPLEFRGTFTTSPGSRSLLCLCGTEDEPLHLPDPASSTRASTARSRTGRAGRRSSAGTAPGPTPCTAARSPSSCSSTAPPAPSRRRRPPPCPRTSTGEKNWDYRFAWVRDLAYTVNALLRFGLREETARGRVVAALGAQGATATRCTSSSSSTAASRAARARRESEGWRGIGPVYAGNPAGGQLQLGVFADIIAVMSQYAHGGNMLDASTQELLTALRRRRVPSLAGEGQRHLGARRRAALRQQQDGLLAGASTPRSDWPRSGSCTPPTTTWSTGRRTATSSSSGSTSTAGRRSAART